MRNVDAICGLTPLTGVPEHGAVRITVTVEEPAHPLAACVGILPDVDANEMRSAIELEFERVDANEWK